VSDAPLSLAVDELVEAIAERVVERLAKSAPAQVEPMPWLDADAAARYLASGRQRIYDLVDQGRVRVARDGRRLLFRREWLDECLDDQSSES